VLGSQNTIIRAYAEIHFKVESVATSGALLKLCYGVTCATDNTCTNRKVAGSIPAGVSGYFIDIKSFRSHYNPGVDSASNRNEYQEHFLGVKAAGA